MQQTNKQQKMLLIPVYSFLGLLLLIFALPFLLLSETEGSAYLLLGLMPFISLIFLLIGIPACIAALLLMRQGEVIKLKHRISSVLVLVIFLLTVFGLSSTFLFYLT